MFQLILQRPPNNGGLSPVVCLTQKNGPNSGRQFFSSHSSHWGPLVPLGSPTGQGLIWPHASSSWVAYIWPTGNPCTHFVSTNSGSAGQTQHRSTCSSQLTGLNLILWISQVGGRCTKFPPSSSLSPGGWIEPLLLCLWQEAGLLSPSLWWEGDTAHQQLFPKRATSRLSSSAFLTLLYFQVHQLETSNLASGSQRPN